MKTFIKLSMAVAMLFVVNMNANAQFGKLKKLADKAKQTVTTGEVSGTEDVTNVASPTTSTSSEGSFMSPVVVENNGAKASGGLDKYIGMTEADEALVFPTTSLEPAILLLVANTTVVRPMAT